VPSDRVCFGAGFGAFGLIATVMATPPAHAPTRIGFRRATLLALHVGLALLMYYGQLTGVRRFENGRRVLAAASPGDHDVVLLNTPIELLANYVGAEMDRPRHRGPVPRTLHQLYSGGSALTVTRIDARTLDLVAERGWGYTAVERIFCAKHEMPGAGDERHFPSMTVRVMEETADAMPKRVRFIFPTPLEAADRTFLVWKGTRPERFAVPAVGERVEIPGHNALSALEM
jgi:hypothetical protein